MLTFHSEMDPHSKTIRDEQGRTIGYVQCHSGKARLVIVPNWQEFSFEEITQVIKEMKKEPQS